ncbi:MAG: 23S rRNA (guanosine(2251)-2'-O)-methyltransferase RlmB, partial [Microcoleus sp. CAN_BIN18]|nr:23S rRNA (guanosine(2251)-2'-O)-methyltransferase RlmB [Microcoleus sp. CAN_BIN18]
MRKFTKPNFSRSSRSNSDSKPFKSAGRRQDSAPSFPPLERKPRPDSRPEVDAPQKRSTFSPQSREMPVRSVFKRRSDSDSQPSIRRNNFKDRDGDGYSSPQPARNNFRDRDSSPQPARNNFRDRDRDGYSSPQPARNNFRDRDRDGYS